MRVFVLTTGRSGSSTFAAACSHITNFTAGHETRTRRIDGRLDYPDQHIEVDPRLAWFMGSLARQHPKDTVWVHLTRDDDLVARSFAARWGDAITVRRRAMLRPLAAMSRVRRWWKDPHSAGGQWIATGFAYSVLMRTTPVAPDQRLALCERMVETMTDNIEEFLSGRDCVFTVRLETMAEDFGRFWSGIGAEGDREAALQELIVRHNARAR